MRKSVGVVVGVLIIAFGMLAFVLIKNRDSGDESLTVANNSPRVPVQLVFLQSLPYMIEATGTLAAKEKVEVYSEVQGILQTTNPPFKAGNTFKRGQVMLQINSEEYRAQVQSSKSSLVNQIAAMLPDMEIEYPEAAKKWEFYLQ
ncbi:MAG: efflux transporter periplasmic adaptor subunit, partial [Bacteroidota bacterium]